jgi:hypothetical protein
VKLDASMRVFSLLFGVVYMLCFYYGVTVVRYYPMTGRFHIDAQPETAGPPILWYGWLLAATVISLVIAVLAPRRLVERLWHGWLWIVPAVTIVGILIYERRWFQ